MGNVECLSGPLVGTRSPGVAANGMGKQPVKSPGGASPR